MSTIFGGAMHRTSNCVFMQCDHPDCIGRKVEVHVVDGVEVRGRTFEQAKVRKRWYDIPGLPRSAAEIAAPW